MKLIFCKKCYDVFGLYFDTIKCRCGESGGVYCMDGNTAKVWGDCKVIGLSNDFLLKEDVFRDVDRHVWWGEYPGDTLIIRSEDYKFK